MHHGPLNLVLTAVLGTLAWVAALFFHRFWRATHDRFFLLFALAFLALGVNWFGLSVTGIPDEARTSLYLVRLVAYVLIIAAVVDKNRAARRPTPPSRG